MAIKTKGKGSCLCGAVHFTAKQVSTNVGASVIAACVGNGVADL